MRQQQQHHDQDTGDPCLAALVTDAVAAIGSAKRAAALAAVRQHLGTGARPRSSHLLTALASGYGDLCSLLLSKGAVLDAAVSLDHPSLRGMHAWRPALTQGLDPNHGALLHQAVQQRQYGIVRALLDAGASVDKRDAMGRVPLGIAVRRRDLGLCQLLMQHGASLGQVDGFGRTVLYYADFAFAKTLALPMPAVGNLGAAYGRRELADAVVCVEDVPHVFVHRVVLAARCAVLRAIIADVDDRQPFADVVLDLAADEPADAVPSLYPDQVYVLKIPCVTTADLPALHILLRYLYTDAVDVTALERAPVLRQQVHRLAHQLQLRRVAAVCQFIQAGCHFRQLSMIPPSRYAADFGALLPPLDPPSGCDDVDAGDDDDDDDVDDAGACGAPHGKVNWLIDLSWDMFASAGSLLRHKKESETETSVKQSKLVEPDVPVISKTQGTALSDLAISISSSGRVFHAHQLVLWHCSSYFRLMLSVEMQERVHRRMPIGDAGDVDDALHAVLVYMYTGSLAGQPIQSPDLALDVYPFALRYTLTDLQSECQRVVLAALEPSVAAYVYARTAAIGGTSQLHRQVQRWILRHWEKVVDSPAWLQCLAHEDRLRLRSLAQRGL